MMTMIFQFSQNSHTHRIVVNEKDVLLEWKRMKGDAFVKVVSEMYHSKGF